LKEIICFEKVKKEKKKKTKKIKQKKFHSLAGNRTRGSWVKANRVTDYTTKELKIDLIILYLN
jgi:hypothetical protein